MALEDMYGDGDEGLTNTEKAAVLFIALGPEYSAKLFQHLDDDEIERITLEIANQKKVSSEVKAKVVSEFYQMAMASDYISTGGLEYAQNVLEKALGAEKAMEILQHILQRASTDHCIDYGLLRTGSGGYAARFVAA